MCAESASNAGDVDELVTRLADAARAAFTEARERHPDDSFYCFALFTDAFAAYVLPTCMSEGGLAQVAHRYAEEFGRPLDEEAESLRWAPVDSPHHMLGEEHFDDVLELLQSRGDPWQLIDDEGLDAEVDLRFEACFRALARTPRQELIATEPGTEHRLAWSADSRILATGECRSRQVRLWRRAPDGFTAGPVLGPPPHHDPADGHDDELRDLAFSPDGGLLACAHSNGEVHIWDVGTGRHVRYLRGLQESMTAVVFLDDRSLAAAGRDVDSGPPVYVWPLSR